MTASNQSEIELPNIPDVSAVYTLWFLDEKGKRNAFYVGETAHLCRRIGEYIVATPHASTDFEVGMEVRRHQEKGYKVLVSYEVVNPSDLRRKREEEVIEYLERAGHKLINSK